MKEEGRREKEDGARNTKDERRRTPGPNTEVNASLTTHDSRLITDKGARAAMKVSDELGVMSGERNTTNSLLTTQDSSLMTGFGGARAAGLSSLINVYLLISNLFWRNANSTLNFVSTLRPNSPDTKDWGGKLRHAASMFFNSNRLPVFNSLFNRSMDSDTR